MVETHPERRDRGNDLSLSGKRGWGTDGLAPTLAAVRNKLEQPLPLGYCQVGVVGAVGDGPLPTDASDQASSSPLSPGPSPLAG